MPLHIPESEFHIETARSSGPGGQNVNKVATKVQLRWNIGASSVLTHEEKEIIRIKLKNRITIEDELMIDVEAERSQAQNRELAIQKLHELVSTALKPAKIRYKTRQTYASKVRRLTEKKKIGEKKQTRRAVAEEG